MRDVRRQDGITETPTSGGNPSLTIILTTPGASQTAYTIRFLDGRLAFTLIVKRAGVSKYVRRPRESQKNPLRPTGGRETHARRLHSVKNVPFLTYTVKSVGEMGTPRVKTCPGEVSTSPGLVSTGPGLVETRPLPRRVLSGCGFF
jgi:hypothetical protein